jgi:uncharacterized coiled-coil protein SlyX
MMPGTFEVVLGKLLEVETAASRAAGVLIDTQAKMAAAAGELGAVATRLGELETRATSAGIAAGAAATDASRAVGAAATEAERRLGDMETRATSARDRVRETTRSLSDELDEFDRNTATKLDDLLFRLKDFDNAWTPAVKDAIEQMRQGLMTGEEFLRKFGDYTITLGDETLKIREFLDGMNLDHYEQQVQEYLRFLRQNTLSLEEILGELGKLNNTYAKDLAEAIRLFTEGRLTFEELLRHAERLKEAFGNDNTAGGLADELLDWLRRNGDG